MDMTQAVEKFEAVRTANEVMEAAERVQEQANGELLRAQAAVADADKAMEEARRRVLEAFRDFMSTAERMSPDSAAKADKVIKARAA